MTTNTDGKKRIFYFNGVGKCGSLGQEMSEERKTIEVVAAVIRREDGCVLATRCPQHKHNGGWEFPGGKIEPGESARTAVEREIAEELGLRIQAGALLHTVEWDYPAFHLRMHCYECCIQGGELRLREHTDSRWLSAATLRSVEWLPADVELLPYVFRA